MDLRLAKEKFSTQQQGLVRDALHAQHHFQHIAGKVFAARLNLRKLQTPEAREELQRLEAEMKAAAALRDTAKSAVEGKSINMVLNVSEKSDGGE